MPVGASKLCDEKSSTAWQQLVNRCFFAKCSSYTFATFHSKYLRSWLKQNFRFVKRANVSRLFTCAPVVQGKLEFELPVAELQLFMASILTAWYMEKSGYGLVVLDFIFLDIDIEPPLLKIHLLSTHINTY